VSEGEGETERRERASEKKVETLYINFFYDLVFMMMTMEKWEKMSAGKWKLRGFFSFYCFHCSALAVGPEGMCD
jgi:hypothetical protein